MSYLKVVISVSAIIGLASCATAPVKIDSDPNQDFSKYSTFSWTGQSPMIANKTDYDISSLAEGRMTQALKSTLEAKGYQFVPSAANADFVVSYTIGARDKVQLETYAPRYYGGYDDWTWGFPYHSYGYDRFPMQYRSTVVKQKEYVRGTLAVDAFDAKKNSPIWHGYASKRLSDDDISKNASDAQESMSTMLLDFPVK